MIHLDRSQTPDVKSGCISVGKVRTIIKTFFTFWPLHIRGKWVAQLIKTHSVAISPNLSSWAREWLQKNTPFYHWQHGRVKRACNVIAQQLHSKYKSRGRVKLHALNSASIEPNQNSPAEEGKRERSKCGRTVLIRSSWESRLTELLKYLDIKKTTNSKTIFST